MAYFLQNPERLGVTHLEYTLVGGLSISQALVISPLAHHLSQRIGLRSTMLLGTMMIFLALFTASFASEIWHLFLSQGICFGWGMGLVYMPGSAALPPWFSTRRSLAVGLATSGAGFGGLAYSLVANSAIQHLGVGWAYRIVALCTLVANLTASLLMKENGRRTKPAAIEAKFTFKDLGRVEMVLIIFWGVVTELGYITLLYSIPSFAASIGLSPAQGSIANALLNLGIALGRPILGYLSDRFGRINMALAMTAVCSGLCFSLWIPSHSFMLLAMFALTVGPLCGAFWMTITPILAEIVGLRKLTSSFSFIMLAMVLPTTFAEPAAMQLVSHDQDRQSYFPVQLFVGCMFLAGTLSLWLLRSWKLFYMESEEIGVEAQKAKRSRFSISWLDPRLFLQPRHV